YGIEQLITESETAAFPIKPVLHSLLAELYSQYYNNNRWRFSKRSRTQDFDAKDIRTWDLQKLVEQTIQQHQKSLENPEELKKIKVDIYDEIIYKGYEGRLFRPTLYDFLAHRAIDYFMGSEPDVTHPAEQFNLNDERFFLPAEEFAKLQLTTVDTLSYKFYALKLLQDMIRFHLTDTGIGPLVDVDLKRLDFVFNNAVIPTKQQLYLQALTSLEKKSISLPISTEVSYRIAYESYSNSEKYQAGVSENFRWDAKEARAMCLKIIERFPQSKGAQDCQALVVKIENKNMSLQYEEVNVPDKDFRGQLKFRNMQKVYFRVHKTTREEMQAIRKVYDGYYEKHKTWKDYNEILIEHFNKKVPLKSFEYTLPDEGDYQEHIAEIRVPGLPSGEYLIMGASSNTFTYNEQAVCYAFTQSNSISYVFRTLPNQDMEFHVMDRESGKPIEGVTAKMLMQKYEYKLGRYVNVDAGTYKSDKSGYFLVKANKEYRSFNVEFHYKHERLFSGNEDNYNTVFYQSERYEEKAHIETFTTFFLDRAIYRPGQTIYFKGIICDQNGKKSKILANYPSVVWLSDVNGQQVASLSVTSNEFGTFNGSFTAPNSGLNGQMTIGDSYGTAYFSVEDYKRPKFEVKVDKAKGAFRINDEVSVTGNAKAYSGANIDGANVKFRVVRKANFPDWWWYYRGNTNQTEILNGVLKTNDKGEFTVKFKALPDPSISPASQAYFSYTIYADVTDINGETRSGSSVVNIGYTTLKISVNIPEQMEKESDKDFTISSSNIDGEFQPAKGTLSIHKLKDPGRSFREKYWGKSDKFLMTKEEYYAIFPFDQYSDEGDYHTWPKEKKVLDQNFDTEANKKFSLNDARGWEQGMYVAEFSSKDKFGMDVKEIRYFTLFSKKETKLPYPQTDWFVNLHGSAEPGEKTEILAGSSLDSVTVLYEVEQGGKLLFKKMLIINKEQKLWQENIIEEYRGNLSIHYTFIKNNRIYLHNETISIPYTNKELDITFETFRDKLQPNEAEEWRIKIKGKTGDRIAAEMAATLYDASLDVFRPNNWTFSVYPHFYSQLNWDEKGSGFNSVGSQLYQVGWIKSASGGYRSYDQLNWFGYYYSAYYDSDGNTYEFASIQKSEDISSKNVKHKDSKKEVSRSMAGAPAMEESDDEVDVPKTQIASSGKEDETKKEPEEFKVRTNFNETAFFYPDLHTDSNGTLIIKFKIPEALTRWKMLGFAHTKDLKFGLVENQLVTQKELMVVPNPPRFFREGDKMSFSAKVTNLSDKDLSGTAQLMLFDALTMKPVDELMGNTKSQRSISIKAGLSEPLTWEIKIPEGMQAVTYRVIAKAGNYSDGEEMTLPVLTNRMLVTESMPMPIRSKQTKTYTLDKMVNNKSTTLKSHKLTLEFTSQPAWYAIQALPYLMEYPYECAEQVFSRFYANSIATHIVNSDPKIKKVFESWQNITPDALLSNLEKNQELKSLMLEETPWLRDAKGESERKKRVAVLFELNRMSRELDRALDKIIKMQKSNGAWAWFEGMPEDRYMTQHIATGLGHLDHLGVKNIRENARTWSMAKDALQYLDNKIRRDYDELKELEARKLIKLSDNNISSLQVQYLYMRSFFKDVPVDKRNQEAVDYFMGQSKKYWLSFGRYLQGMIALSLSRNGETVVTADIIKSLREFAIVSDEMGMYWKQDWGYFWYQAPVETQSLMVEVFDEVAKDQKAVDDLKVWLIKNKQTTDWKTTKATADACYALLLQGTNWLASDELVQIKVGDITVDPRNMPDVKVEAGTGYFKTSWTGPEIKPEMGTVVLTKKDEGVSWGALYWQYFEQLDKITPHETPLKLKKQLFLEKNTASGPVIVPVTDKTELKPG
ncbi:MAG: alpha-2-macroglobulin family protein, partial [Cytophagaceae bacterium]